MQTRFLRSSVRSALTVACFGFAWSCRQADARSNVTPTAVLTDISDSAWDALAQRRIFFGHQSVGFNILEGVKDIVANNPRIRLRIVRSDAPATVQGPALIHTTIGENRRPDLKNSEFTRIVSAGFGDAGGIALFKYCFLDVDSHTDVRQLFESYRATIDSLHAKYPRLTLVEVTEPLVVAENPVVSRLRLALGKESERMLNVKRADFNRRIIETFGPRGTVFDLARFESTRPDGSREAYTVGRDSAYALVPTYTNDGAHLNERGRRVIAEQFLSFLARVGSSN